MLGDRTSRARLRVLRIYPRCDQKTAIQFVDYVLQRMPFQVQTIQTDNGADFQSAFHFHVLDKGVGHAYIKPRTPRLNGEVERSHRIDAEEFYRLPGGCGYVARASTTLRGEAVCTTRVIWNPAWLSRSRYSAAVRSRAPKFSSISKSTHFPGKSRL